MEAVHGTAAAPTLSTAALRERLDGVVRQLASVILGKEPTLRLALACLLVAGGGWVATLTTLNVAMQLRSPEAILGRCMAIYQAVTFGGMAIGAYALGLVADLTGTGTAILSAAGLMAGSLPVLRRFAPMPTREEGRVAA